MSKKLSQGNEELPMSKQLDLESIEKGEFVFYNSNEVTNLEVMVKNDTVWLTQMHIAKLFGVNQPAISKHISNIYSSGELEKEDTYSILEYMGNDGRQRYSTKYYNLDMILSVGYRVNSKNAILFRRWSNSILKEYLLKGYAINARFNQIEDKIDRKFAEFDKRINEHEYKIDFFVRTSIKDLGQKLCAVTLLNSISAAEILSKLI